MANTDKQELDLLIKNCQKGNSDAQRVVYEIFAPKMFGVCMRYCKSREEAEDCLQEGFVKVFVKIDGFQFKGSFEGWIRRIIVNTIMESFRKKNPVIPVDDFASFTIPEEEAAPNESELGESELLKMIDSLPPQYRMVFNLYAMEEYSHEEIANTLGISVGTSKSNLSRARQWLKERINERMKVVD
jgi:RNA polymerase sigma-70 factor (ECF subfamily)